MTNMESRPHNELMNTDTAIDNISTPSIKVGNTPWVEKYRPRKFEDITHQNQVISALSSVVSSGNLPHLLFFGTPGTGKTTCALTTAHILFGEANVKNRVLELNASDDRGIEAIRTKVKTFAQLAVETDATPPFKMVILDEADSMTKDAQSSLRRIIEDYTKCTRFVIICNRVSRIIGPLQSRCSRFRFSPIPRENIIERLSVIWHAELAGDTLVHREHFQHEENTIDELNTADEISKARDMILSTILEVCPHDMRSCINTLQILISGLSLEDILKIEADTIRDISGKVPLESIESFLLNILPFVLEPGNFGNTVNQHSNKMMRNEPNAKKLKGGTKKKVDGEFILKLCEEISGEGYSVRGIIRGICDILSKSNINLQPSSRSEDLFKSHVYRILGTADARLSNSCDGRIVLLDVCMQIQHLSVYDPKELPMTWFGVV